MKKLILVLVLAQSLPLLLTAQVFLNLDFEHAIEGSSSLPQKWYVGGDGYTILLDETEHLQGEYSLKISADKTSQRSFGVATGSFPIEAALGKQIRFTGYIKTSNLTKGNAGLWMRVDGPDGVLAFDNLDQKKINGNTKWTKYEIVLDVPQEAAKINFGVLHGGVGHAWFDNLEIFLDGELYESLAPLKREPTTEEIAWLKSRIIPLSTIDPEQPIGDEIIQLREDLENAKVVGLGEVSHGSSEIFQMKHRLIRYLYQDLGFTRFALEANMTEAYAVNSFLEGSDQPSVGELLKNMHFWTWNTKEVSDLIQWMRSYNQQTKTNLEFTGFDMQFQEGPIAELSRLLGEEALEGVTQEFQYLNNLRKQQNSSMSFSPAQSTYVREEFSRIQQMINDHDFDAKTMFWAHQQVRLLIQYAEMSSSLSRDKFMAENLHWIHQQAPAEKIVIWAHNGHIQQTDRRMGQYLNDVFGEDYLSIGFAFYQGAYTAVGENGLNTYQAQTAYSGTYEDFFEATDEPIFLLDLRDIDRTDAAAQWVFANLPFRSVGSMKTTQEFNEAAIYDDFDLILFIRDSSASQRL